MKKLFLLFACTIALCAGFVSCSDDDEADSIKTDMIGTWEVTHVKTNVNSSYTPWMMQTTSAQFKADGTYVGRGYFGNGTGTYTVKGSTIHTYVNGKQYFNYEVLYHNGSTAEMRMYMEDTSVWLKCKKR